MNRSPLSRAWSTLMRHPFLMLVPAVWEATTYWTTYLFVTVPGQGAAGKVVFRLLLPPSLPSGSDLLGNPGPPGQASLISLGAALLLSVAGSFVMAGYLHLLLCALRGDPLNWDQFVVGINRFGGRMFVWRLAFFALITFAGLTVFAAGPAGVLLILVGIPLAVAYYLVDFLIVAEDAEVKQAVSLAPARLIQHLPSLLPVTLASIATSLVLSTTLSSSGMNTLLLAGPLWAWFGTWLALAVLLVVTPPGVLSDSGQLDQLAG